MDCNCGRKYVAGSWKEDYGKEDSLEYVYNGEFIDRSVKKAR